MSDLHYDPYSEEALRDPYAIYKRLRAEKHAYFLERVRERRKNPSEEPAHG